MKKNTIDDRLPDGLGETHYLQVEQEWPRLQNRLGKPRILSHHFYQDVLDWVNSKFWNNPDDFSYLEAGVGHGNDLRALRAALQNRGFFLGVDYSAAEILHGLSFYKARDNENTEEAVKLFAQGDLRDLKHLSIWSAEDQGFTKPYALPDGEFSLVYLEAVLQAAGLGYDRYKDKKQSAQKYLKEISRVCQPGGRFFGRISAFLTEAVGEKQHEIMRLQRNWQFVPGVVEFSDMLVDAGFSSIDIKSFPHENAAANPEKKEFVKLSFLVSK